MFDLLLTRSEELRAPLNQFITSRLGPDRVQGATLGIDQYWLNWRFAEFSHRYVPYPYLPFLDGWIRNRLLFGSHFDWNLDDLPPNWDTHCRTMGYPEGSSPLVIRVQLTEHLSRSRRTRKGLEGESDLPRSFETHPLIYEVIGPVKALSTAEWFGSALNKWFSPREHVHADRGISIGRALPKATAGTLGGVLRSNNDATQYLVSCAHVLGEVDTTVYTPGPYENQGCREIGIVRHSELPEPQEPGQGCSLYATPNAGRLDLAVAEITGTGSLGQNSGAASILSPAAMVPYQRISFNGKVSGHVVAFVNSCTIWQSIELDDGHRCFGQLFDVVAPRGSRSPIAQGGDSGAWINCDFGGLSCWAGMIIGSTPTGDRAFACFAEHIIDSCRNRFPGGLSLA